MFGLKQLCFETIDYWEIEPEDVTVFYDICAHEISLIGHSW